MQSDPDTQETPTEDDGNKELGAVVSASLIHIADLRDVEDRAKDVSERISKLTPPPVVPETPPAPQD